MPDPRRLLEAQSVPGAVAAGIGAIVITSSLWMWLAVVLDRVFPWFSIVQGLVLGLAVRRYGRGFDWRFPAIAALLALAGAIIGNLLVALPTTAGELGTSPLAVVRGLTWWSFETFFAEVVTPVDHVYALFAAAVAAFYARRRLTREEVFALRTMNDGRHRGSGDRG